MAPMRPLRSAVSVLVAILGCGPGPTPDPGAQARERAQIAAALERYLVAARAVNSDSIRAFVASFPGVQVESATAVPDTIELFGNTAYLWGSYYERLVFPGQPRSEQHGRFVIEWVRQDGGPWLIQRYFRVPVPAPPSGQPTPAR